MLPRVRQDKGAKHRHPDGDIAERLVQEALRRLTRSGDVKVFGYVHSGGRDFEVTLACGCQASLQVTRSQHGKMRHYHRYRRLDVAVLVTGGWSRRMTNRQAKELIARITEQTRDLLTDTREIAHTCG